MATLLVITVLLPLLGSLVLLADAPRIESRQGSLPSGSR